MSIALYVYIMSNGLSIGAKNTGELTMVQCMEALTLSDVRCKISHHGVFMQYYFPSAIRL